jgi:hypothetical protein
MLLQYFLVVVILPINALKSSTCILYNLLLLLFIIIELNNDRWDILSFHYFKSILDKELEERKE